MSDLYPERKNPAWPPVDLQITRDALMAAEVFRNAVVHSLWHIGGAEPQWRRTKASLRSKGRLSVSSGAVNLGAFDEGVPAGSGKLVHRPIGESSHCSSPAQGARE